MRLLTVRERWREPEADSELMSRAIQYYERKPRANSHRHTASSVPGEVIGGLALMLVGIVLGALLLTF